MLVQKWFQPATVPPLPAQLLCAQRPRRAPLNMRWPCANCGNSIPSRAACSKSARQRLCTQQIIQDPPHFVNLLRVWNSFAYASKIKSIPCDTSMRSSRRVPSPMPFLCQLIQQTEACSTPSLRSRSSSLKECQIRISPWSPFPASPCSIFLAPSKRFVTPSTRQSSIALWVSIVAVDRTWSSRETLVLTTREKAFVPRSE